MLELLTIPRLPLANNTHHQGIPEIIIHTITIPTEHSLQVTSTHHPQYCTSKKRPRVRNTNYRGSQALCGTCHRLSNQEQRKLPAAQHCPLDSPSPSRSTFISSDKTSVKFCYKLHHNRFTINVL